MSDISKTVCEINENFNDLGADLVLLEALLQAIQGKHNFPEEFVESGLKWMGEAICQHTADIAYLSEFLIREAPRATELPAQQSKCTERTVGRRGRPAHEVHALSTEPRQRTVRQKTKQRIRCHPRGDAPGILKP